MHVSMNDTVDAIGQTQSLLRWRINIVSPASAVGAPPKDWEIMCTSSGTPQSEMEVTQLKLNGHTINTDAKVTKNGSLPMTLAEDEEHRIQKFLVKWHNTLWSGDGSDTQGKRKKVKEVKAHVVISQLDGQDVVTYQYKLIGAFPKPVSSSTLGQDAEDQMREFEWVYDDYHEGAKGSFTW